MGACQTKSSALGASNALHELERSIHDPKKTHRQKMAWHREGVPVTEVYDILEIVGQGSMGEVTIVQKKVDTLAKIERKYSNMSDSERKSPERQTSDASSGDELTATALSESAAARPVAKGSARKYACKTVNTLRMKDDEMKEFINEIDILRDLDHPNIVQLFEVYKVKRKMWIVTELCSGGDLTARATGMTEADVVVVLEQILRAVAYMHKRNVCHRDIKLENIMYSDAGPDAVIKLIDFGLSNKFTKGEKMLKACGTIYAAAPELLFGHGYTEQTDVWSVGVVAFVLLSQCYPFLRELEELEDEIKRDNLANARYTFGYTWKERNISKCGKEFVAYCFRKHPGARWSSREALDFVQQQWIPHLESQRDSKEGNPSNGTMNPAQAALVQQVQSPETDESDRAEGDDKVSEMKPHQPLDKSTKAIRKRTRMPSDMVFGMETFTGYGELKKTILMTMAYTMDKSSLHELRDIFTTLDSHNNGIVTLIDLKNALRSMHSDKNMDDETIEKLFHGIDVDHSGQIHYNEFLAAVAESQGLITMEHLADVFDRLDSDGKGYISKDDLREVLGTDYNEEMVNRMIDEADYKKNGQIDYDEFLRLMFEDPATGMKNMGQSNITAEDKGMAEKLVSLDPSGSLSFRSLNVAGEKKVANQ